MNVEKFVNILGAEFYTGVPDSQLKCLCDYLMNTYGIDKHHHIIAANEGNCTALAAGYHLATGKIPVVYLQNSGIGNIINPVASLLNNEVYAIPTIFVIGWRGEPYVHDEPQHIYQGKVTLKLLEDMGIKVLIISEKTTENELRKVMKDFSMILNNGGSVAFLIRKNAFSYNKKTIYKNKYIMAREDVIRHIVNVSDTDPVISTTGKTSRELFEIRIDNEQGHEFDFLTVGSMGHSSSIALSIALHQPLKKIWCISGDGAELMHMGAMAIIGTYKPENMVHIIINNGAHETVGGMPTVANNINLVDIAKACGYPYTVQVDTFERLDKELLIAKTLKKLCLIEVKCSIGARNDLGRPTTTTIENKHYFMQYLMQEK